MKTIITIISFILLFSSCFIHKGQRINGQCRPKKENFTLVKTPFKETDKLTFNKIYIVENVTKAVGYGFYPDGRIIYVHSKDGFGLKSEDVYGKTWYSAPAIGYWRIEQNQIKTEYFSCSNSGNYIKEKGFVRNDTIFFERVCGSNPFKSEICYDKYILSDLSFE